MITTAQKHEIVQLIEAEKIAQGSYSKVATLCDIRSTATISNNMIKPENWDKNVSDAMWVKVGKTLGYKFQTSQWNVVETAGFMMVQSTLSMAQSDSRFMMIAYHAESGKTASMKAYKDNDETNTVYYLECKEWSRKLFLQKLAQTFAINLGEKHTTNEDISDKIIAFLKQRTTVGKPLLIFDQGNSLKPSALRWFIDLYNELEDEIGVVLAGTEELEKTIKKGVQKFTKGFDEIESRFGRKYIKLKGCNYKDVEKICIGNGVKDSEMIDKIWRANRPKERLNSQNKYEEFVDNLRQIKNQIKMELKLQQLKNIA